MKKDGKDCHDTLVKNAKPILAFDENRDYKTWKEEIRAKFYELSGLNEVEANAEPNPQFEIVKEEKLEGHTRYYCLFESEIGAVVSMYVLIPDGIKEHEKRPLIITQQGHSTGFHNSVGIEIYEEDKKYQETRGKFANQSVQQGYITAAIENRGMGERAAQNEEGRRVYIGKRRDCYYEEMTALLMGRSLIAERCFDVKCAIDMILKHFGKNIDQRKIVLAGNSGGGTVSFYASCYDERICLSVPSSAFCPYPESILRFYHCSCNYIGHAFKWFDMQDLACLIAPRPFFAINGKTDPSFKDYGVIRGFETVKKIYEKEGVPEKCHSIIMQDRGHFWGVEYVWPVIASELAKLGDEIR